MPLDKNFAYSLPCTKGKQFKPFYSVNVPASVLVQLLKLDNEGSVLKRSQREVNVKRAKAFAEYLVDNYKKFYIIPTVIGVVKSKKDKAPQFEEAVKGSRVGHLHISLDSKIRLFDGQHRATGLDIALELFCDKLAEIGFKLDEVDIPVMLYTNLTLAERQLGFTDINQNISKPQQSISDAFNSRDPLPILARNLASECVAFKGLVDMEHNTITKKSEFFFPLKGLKDATQVLLGLGKKVAEITPEQQEIASKFWTVVSREMGWGGLAFIETKAEQVREENILTHVATLKTVALAGNIAMQFHNGFENVNWAALGELNYSRDKDESDFTGRIIDKISGNMTPNKLNIDLAANLMLKVLDVTLSQDRTDLELKYFPDGYEIKGAPVEQLSTEEPSTQEPSTEEAA